MHYAKHRCIKSSGARIDQLRAVLDKQAMDPSIVQIMQSDDQSGQNGRKAAKILLGIFRDVVQQNRLHSTSRCLKLSDPDFQTCLLNVPGAMECLFAAGYQVGVVLVETLIHRHINM